MLVLVGSAAAESPLKWSPATNIDGTYRLAGISCPSVGLCVAIDSPAGDVITTTEPTGGAAAWTVTPIGTDDATGVSCALGTESSKLCVAVDCMQTAWFATNPIGGAGAWTATPFENHGCGLYPPLTAVSCPSTAICVAADQRGNVIASGDATGPGSEWHYASVDGEETINAISCPTTSLCVAVANHGNVITSTSPLGGAGSWHVANIDGTTVLRSVSCAYEPALPQPVLCVVGGEGGNVLTSTEPTAGEGAWTAAHVDGTAGVLAMSCPSVTLCVGLDNQAGAVTSTHPTAGAAAWTREVIDTGQLLTAVSCPSITLCVAADWHGNIVEGTGATTPPPPPPNPEVISKGKAGTPETHVIAPEAQVLSTESNGEGQVTTLLSCASVGGECGPLNIQLSAQLKVEGKKVVGVLAKAKKKKARIKSVVVASATVNIAPGQEKKVTLTLNATGKSLLARFKHLSTQMRVISKGTVLSTRTVKLTKSAKHGHKKKHH
jgi:hypothetical protein